MRISGLLTLVVLIIAGQSFVNAGKLPGYVQLPRAQCTDQWTGTILYRVNAKRQGTAENNVNVAHWNEERFYETKAELDGSRNEQGAQIANVRAISEEKKDWGSRGKGVCYRETDNSQAVQGTANETTTAFSISLNPRTREYSILAPTLMVYAAGELTVSSRVKGTCNNPYNKDRYQTTKLERYQLSDDAPVLMGKGTIDPAKPDELVGSETVEHDTSKGKKTVTIKWELRRCAKQ